MIRSNIYIRYRNAGVFMKPSVFRDSGGVWVMVDPSHRNYHLGETHKTWKEAFDAALQYYR